MTPVLLVQPKKFRCSVSASESDAWGSCACSEPELKLKSEWIEGKCSSIVGMCASKLIITL